MIYDLFCFFNELDVLHERLNYLDKYVGKFVICESNVTHTGMPKPFVFEENQERFSKFKSKIIYLKFFGEKHDNAWVNENLQRNFILNQVNFEIDDKIIISDVDEIPSENFIKKLVSYNGNEILISIQELSFFWPNYKRSDMPYWIGGSRAFNYNRLKNLKYLNTEYSSTYLRLLNKGNTLTKIRLTNIGLPIDMGGWHLSYMGGKKAIEKKIISFAHTELNEKIGSNVTNHLNEFLINEKDFFKENETYLINGSFKSFILKNKKSSVNKFTTAINFKWHFIKNKLILKILLKRYAKKLLLWSK